MKKIVLFGAGKRGKKVAELMYEKNMEVYAFCDSKKTGQVKTTRGG